VIHRALKLPPVFWPCLPDPASDNASPAAMALYEELEAVLAV
jgi:hypothetical protein